MLIKLLISCNATGFPTNLLMNQLRQMQTFWPSASEPVKLLGWTNGAWSGHVTCERDKTVRMPTPKTPCGIFSVFWWIFSSEYSMVLQRKCTAALPCIVFYETAQTRGTHGFEAQVTSKAQRQQKDAKSGMRWSEHKHFLAFWLWISGATSIFRIPNRSVIANLVLNHVEAAFWKLFFAADNVTDIFKFDSTRVKTNINWSHLSHLSQSVSNPKDKPRVSFFLYTDRKAAPVASEFRHDLTWRGLHGSNCPNVKFSRNDVVLCIIMNSYVVNLTSQSGFESIEALAARALSCKLRLLVMTSDCLTVEALWKQTEPLKNVLSTWKTTRHGHLLPRFVLSRSHLTCSSASSS